MGLRLVEVLKIAKVFQNSGILNAKLCMMGKQDLEKTSWTRFMQKVKMFQLSYDEEQYERIKNIYPMDSCEVFKMFGFSEVHALDYSSYEGADIIFDLNAENLPVELVEQFDFIVNGGTLEHVFNQAIALKNMSKMVKKGGYIYHISPLSGWINHGFYSMSPTLFLDYYTENNWYIDESDIEIRVDSIADDFKGSIYSMDCRMFDASEQINALIRDYAGNTTSLLRCWARKTSESEVEKTPIQGMYKEIYHYHENVHKEWSSDKVIAYLKEKRNKRVALYGAGHDCGILVDELYKNDMEGMVDYVFDSNIELSGCLFRGYQVVYPTLKKIDAIDVIVIASSAYEDEIYNSLIERGVSNEKLVKISNIL